MKIVYISLLMLIASSSYAEVNTQYPGCTPSGSTATEVNTRPEYYYVPQAPLNQDAKEAKEAQKKQQ